MTEVPTHLNCPFCLAQAYTGDLSINIYGIRLQGYRCPAKHAFYIPTTEEAQSNVVTMPQKKAA